MNDIPFSRIIDLRRIGEAGLQETVTADATERAAVAAAFDILDLSRFEATVTISPWNRVGFKVEGRLVADAVQACVVTLEPVPEQIEHPFSLSFLPPETQAAEPRTVAEAEVIVDIDAEDPPDPLTGPLLDLGVIATEQLALALDPYPRAPGATLPAAPETGADETAQSPFAALAGLKLGRT